MAPSSLGTFLRSFTFGHVRQLDKVTAVALARAWAAGTGPGDAPMTIDLDSTVCEVHGYAKGGASYGHTRRLGYHPPARHPGRDRRGPTRPPAHRQGQHRPGRGALSVRDGGPRPPGRGRRTTHDAGGLGVPLRRPDREVPGPRRRGPRKQQPGDEEARQHEEDVHTDIAPPQQPHSGVPEHDQDDGDGAKPLDVVPMSELPTRHGSVSRGPNGSGVWETSGTRGEPRLRRSGPLGRHPHRGCSIPDWQAAPSLPGFVLGVHEEDASGVPKTFAHRSGS